MGYERYRMFVEERFVFNADPRLDDEDVLLVGVVGPFAVVFSKRNVEGNIAERRALASHADIGLMLLADTRVLSLFGLVFNVDGIWHFPIYVDSQWRGGTFSAQNLNDDRYIRHVEVILLRANARECIELAGSFSSVRNLNRPHIHAQIGWGGATKHIFDAFPTLHGVRKLGRNMVTDLNSISKARNIYARHRPCGKMCGRRLRIRINNRIDFQLEGFCETLRYNNLS